MKSLFDDLSFEMSRRVTETYSSSFSIAVKMLAPQIQPAIHSIYGFVRFADEIVDTFHGYDKEALLDDFERQVYDAIEKRISLNPILNSFQQTVHDFKIDDEMIAAFLKSMRMDLHKQDYYNVNEYLDYIYGSADVVGLMCLKVFVNGDDEQYDALKDSAMKLGSAFQKVNFLRDIKNDTEVLNRNYFPHVNFEQLSPEVKAEIIQEIEDDFSAAREGISKLPPEARFGVYTAYIYYKKLLSKLKRTPASKILQTRIRVNGTKKLELLAKSYFQVKLNIIQ